MKENNEGNNKKISIIIPVYNVENYLERCLNSLVNQTLQNIEIIIINDGSTDNSENIIKNYLEKYPDMIKSFTTGNVGPAKARNIGLENATGEYIGFVDSDDYVSENMYEKLYNKAKEENSDIVTCAYYRVYEEKSIEKEVLDNLEFGKSASENHELLIETTPYVWNKIFKTELIKKNNAEFANLRIYEDLVFTYSMLITANRISKVYEPLYFYTVTRQTSLTHKFSEKRFDIFKAFDELKEFAKRKNCLNIFKDDIIYIFLKHFYVVLEQDVSADTANLKKKYINEVFKFANSNMENWKDNYYFERSNKNKKNYTSKKYWKLRILLNKKIRGKAKRLKDILKKLFSTKISIGKKFLKYMKEPIDEKAILLNSQQGDNINGNMFYLLKALQNDNFSDYKIYVAHKNEKLESFKEKLDKYNFRYKLINNESKKYAKILATSKFLFNDTSFPIYFIKRKEQIYLNTWHGTPLKTLGKATANDFYDIANLQKNFVVSDYLLYPSKYMLDHMMEDYMLNNIANGKILLSGYPRNEIFFDEVRRKSLREELNLENKELIAYMPTWRGNVRNVSLEEQLEQIKDYLMQIDGSLKSNQILYVNFHPYVGNNIDFAIYNNIKPFPSEYETYDFLNICDVLITDYSSVFFDYSITKNKIILFAYDEEEYLKDRGMYLQLSELPFPIVKNVEQLIKEINEPKQYNDEEFLKKYCNYDAKDVSTKICNFIILNKKEKLVIKNIEKNKKKNVLIYAGVLNKNSQTDELILSCKNAKENLEYNYYMSYITRKIKKNKRQLKDLENNGMNYMGQLGILSNTGKCQNLLLSLVGRLKFMYNITKNKVDAIYKTELKRNYDDIEFKATILYGKIGIRKIYEFSNISGKKILYLTCKKDFNKKVNKKIYERYNHILCADEEVFEEVKKYCKNAKALKINKIDNLNEFNKYIY